MPKYEDLPYRPCAGLCVINRKGLVFIGRRTDGPEHIDATHVWQMPQGGIDEGEKPYPAALRELYEETNIKSVEKLGEISGLARPTTSRRNSAARPGTASTAARSRNGTRCASPARTARSTSKTPAAGTSRNSSNGAGSRWRIFPDLVVPFKRDIYERVVKAFVASSTAKCRARDARPDV